MPAETNPVDFVSIHAFREEGDCVDRWSSRPFTSFNPRLPGGRRLLGHLRCCAITKFQSTPSGRKATRNPANLLVGNSVSIHAFREEGDVPKVRDGRSTNWFQSTPSGRKATPPAQDEADARSVSIHAFREEGDASRYRTASAYKVSIHAFREEGDSPAHAAGAESLCFNPRLPGGRRRVSALPGRCGGGFNPRLPGGRRPSATRSASIVVKFQSTPSGRKATPRRPPTRCRPRVSIHAFREEGDYDPPHIATDKTGFNPRLPGGRRPPGQGGVVPPGAFQSTPSGRKATTPPHALFRFNRFQSTPSGRKATFSDSGISAASMFQSTPSGRKATQFVRGGGSSSVRFNPRLPGGRRHHIALASASGQSFQSTPSGRKATRVSKRRNDRWEVSIHAFREEGDEVPRVARRTVPVVSIHAFREEGDLLASPTWETVAVSIHAFREEGDVPAGTGRYLTSLFQSTPSGRKATHHQPGGNGIRSFQSTPSGRKATLGFVNDQVQRGVSIHAFREEGDALSSFGNRTPPGFQSTPSGRKATHLNANRGLRRAVSIHAFREEGDVPRQPLPGDDSCFNPRLPGGRRPVMPKQYPPTRQFQSTPSGRKATRGVGVMEDRRRRFNPRLPGGRRRC